MKDRKVLKPLKQSLKYQQHRNNNNTEKTTTQEQQQHRNNNTGTTTQEQQHKNNKTGTTTQEQQHKNNNTGTTTQKQQQHSTNNTGPTITQEQQHRNNNNTGTTTTQYQQQQQQHRDTRIHLWCNNEVAPCKNTPSWTMGAINVPILFLRLVCFPGLYKWGKRLSFVAALLGFGAVGVGSVLNFEFLKFFKLFVTNFILKKL